MSQNDTITYNPKQIYNIAYSFLLAANRCNEPRVQNTGFIQMLIVPAVVNAAFSCELSIKAILNQSSIPVPRGSNGHRIDTLFHSLPSELQSKIIAEVNSSDFHSNIENISNAFVEWRYLFEKDTTSISFDFLMTLANLLCDEAEQIIAESSL